MKYEKYLPAVIVFLLNMLMIAGFCLSRRSDAKMYDYIRYLYPEGVIPDKYVVMFNHKQIYKVYFFEFIG